MAPIGEDNNNNGMQLSVLSALARQDVDPWEEAAQLAGLPTEAATQRLTFMIAALPHGPSTSRSSPGTIAARLIALLPRRAGTDIRSRLASIGTDPVMQSWRVRYVIFSVIFMVFLLMVQWLIPNHVTATQSDKPSTPIVSAASSQAPPRSSAQRRAVALQLKQK